MPTSFSHGLCPPMCDQPSQLLTNVWFRKWTGPFCMVSPKVSIYIYICMYTYKYIDILYEWWKWGSKPPGKIGRTKTLNTFTRILGAWYGRKPLGCYKSSCILWMWLSLLWWWPPGRSLCGTENPLLGIVFHRRACSILASATGEEGLRPQDGKNFADPVEHFRIVSHFERLQSYCTWWLISRSVSRLQPQF